MQLSWVEQPWHCNLVVRLHGLWMCRYVFICCSSRAKPGQTGTGWPLNDILQGAHVTLPAGGLLRSQALDFRNQSVDEPYICKATMALSKSLPFCSMHRLQWVHWPGSLQVNGLVPIGPLHLQYKLQLQATFEGFIRLCIQFARVRGL